MVQRVHATPASDKTVLLGPMPGCSVTLPPSKTETKLSQQAATDAIQVYIWLKFIYKLPLPL